MAPQILVNSNFDRTVSGSHACVNTSLRVFRLNALVCYTTRSLAIAVRHATEGGAPVHKPVWWSSAPNRTFIEPDQCSLQGVHQLLLRPMCGSEVKRLRGLVVLIEYPTVCARKLHGV